MAGYNYTDAEDKVFEAGEYEAVLINADVRTTNSGKQYLNLCFKIDGGNVYTKVFEEANEPGTFNKKRIGQLLGALKVLDEIPNNFELIKAVKNKRCIVNITKEYSDYKQAEENNIKFFKSSNINEPVVQETPKLDNVSDDDLPF